MSKFKIFKAGDIITPDVPSEFVLYVDRVIVDDDYRRYDILVVNSTDSNTNGIWYRSLIADVLSPYRICEDYKTLKIDDKHIFLRS